MWFVSYLQLIHRAQQSDFLRDRQEAEMEMSDGEEDQGPTQTKKPRKEKEKKPEKPFDVGEQIKCKIKILKMLLYRIVTFYIWS